MIENVMILSYPKCRKTFHTIWYAPSLCFVIVVYSAIHVRHQCDVNGYSLHSLLYDQMVWLFWFAFANGTNNKSISNMFLDQCENNLNGHTHTHTHQYKYKYKHMHIFTQHSFAHKPYDSTTSYYKNVCFCFFFYFNLMPKIVSTNCKVVKFGILF